MSNPPPIWVLDDITVRAGCGPSFLTAYLTHYVPMVERSGLTLVHRLVEPAMWLADEPNRILFLWSAPNPGVIWQAKQVLRNDPAIMAWWQEEAPAMVEHRRRATLAEAEALEALADV